MNLDDVHSGLVAVVERYERAFNDGDADSMIELFTPDTVFVNVAGNLVRGAEDLHRAQESVFDETTEHTRGGDESNPGRGVGNARATPGWRLCRCRELRRPRLRRGRHGGFRGPCSSR